MGNLIGLGLILAGVLGEDMGHLIAPGVTMVTGLTGLFAVSRGLAKQGRV